VCVLKPCVSWFGAPPADDRVGELNEAEIVVRMNLVANPEPTEQIVPAVRSLDHPTPRLESRIGLALPLLLPARLDVWEVASTLRRAAQLRVVIAFVAAKVLARFLLWRGPRDHHRIQGGAEPFHVVPVGAREGGGQRNAVGVREIMSLGAQFAAVCRVSSSLVAPLTGAGTVAESSDWNRQSIPLRSS
jgi:hypothetical protein